MEYEAVIGLEVHVQLKTASKMFTRVAYQYGEPANSLTNPVVMGMPGTLPVMNREAIEKTIRVGLMLGCDIAEVCKWDRKHYWYPDMPKNYQISQYDQPICIGGSVEIEMPGSSRNVMGEHKSIKLTRIHLEEDVAKITHFENESLIDYNRAGAPLIEIVSEPDMHSADEAFAFLTALRMYMSFAGLADCDMEKGQMRCDANVSVRPVGETRLGTKVELKNMNTISGVKAGLEYEIKRQIRALKDGKTIIQQTSRWNPDLNMTVPMRTKEDAHDYRYFPDPDLMPVKISSEWLESLMNTLPEMPWDKQRRYMEEYKLPYTVTSVICPNRELTEYFETCLQAHNNPRSIANLIANDLLRELSSQTEAGESVDFAHCPVKPTQLAALVKLVDDGVISKQIAQDVLRDMFATGEEAISIIEKKGLKQTDSGELEGICRDVIEANPKPANEFRQGKDKAINALKGQVMRATRGKANPQAVDQLLRKLLIS